jgi:hypothetical protein
VIHVYAFADELRELPPLDGIDGAPLELRTIAGLDAVVSRRTGRTEQDSLRADALVHGQIVEAVADRAAAVLPVRFAEPAPSDDRFEETVKRQAGGLRRRLEQVRGCVELGLRIIGPAAAPPARAATGAAYMEGLRQAAAVDDGAIDRLHRELAGLSREASLRRVGSDRIGAYLLPRASVDAAKSAVDRFALGQPALTVLCTGPWAPYSFAGDAS